MPHTERIEEIKFNWAETKSTHQFRPLTLEVKDVEWLIKQAEKVEVLEKEKSELLCELERSDAKLLNIKQIINE